MLEVGKLVIEGLRALASISILLFLAVLIIGLLVLYAPPVPGLGLEAVRSEFGHWTGLVTVSAGVIVVLRSLAWVASQCTNIVGARLNRDRLKTTAALRFTINQNMTTATLIQSIQPDKSIVSQIIVDFLVHNSASADLYLSTARLISPRVPLQDTLAVQLIVSDPRGANNYSAKHPILSGMNANGRLVLMVKRPLGRPGTFLRAVICFTDNTGHEYEITSKLWVSR